MGNFGTASMAGVLVLLSETTGVRYKNQEIVFWSIKKTSHSPNRAVALIGKFIVRYR